MEPCCRRECLVLILSAPHEQESYLVKFSYTCPYSINTEVRVNLQPFRMWKTSARLKIPSLPTSSTQMGCRVLPRTDSCGGLRAHGPTHRSGPTGHCLCLSRLQRKWWTGPRSRGWALQRTYPDRLTADLLRLLVSDMKP